MFEAFLLSMQASGLIIDYSQNRSQQKFIRLGRDLEQSAIDTNLQAIKTESAEASLAEMKELRQNIGTQIANNAARGTSSSAGSALTASNKSIENFNADERSRRMNLLAKEANLRASGVLSGLHTLSSETQLGQQLTKGLFENLPTYGLNYLNSKSVKKVGNKIASSFGFKEQF